MATEGLWRVPSLAAGEPRCYTSAPLHAGHEFTVLSPRQLLLLPLDPHKLTHCDTLPWSLLLSSAIE